MSMVLQQNPAHTILTIYRLIDLLRTGIRPWKSSKPFCSALGVVCAAQLPHETAQKAFRVLGARFLIAGLLAP